MNTEFDRGVDQMKGRECGDDCHFGDHDAPAAPERGEWRVKVTGANVYILDADDNAIASLHNQQITREIVERYEQHCTLIAQRERLLRLLRPVTSPTACYCAVMKGEKCWHCEARELITTIEQEGTRQ